MLAEAWRRLGNRAEPRHLDGIAGQPHASDVRMIVLDDHVALGNGRFGESTVEIVHRRGRHFGRTQAIEPILDAAGSKYPFELGYERCAIFDAMPAGTQRAFAAAPGSANG